MTDEHDQTIEDGAQNMMRLFQISEQLTDAKDLDIMGDVDREFVRDGVLKKNKADRMIFLLSDMLVITKAKTNKKGQGTFEFRRALRFDCETRLRTYRHSTDAKLATAFDISVPDGNGRYTLNLASSSAEECDSWVTAVKGCIMSTIGDQEPLSCFATHYGLVAGTLPYDVLTDNLSLVQQLSKTGDLVDVASEPDHFGATAFTVAAYCGAASVLDAMLAAEGATAAASVPDSNGNTPLCIAAARGHAAVVAVMGAAGMDMSAPDFNDITPLQYAVVSSCDDAIDALTAGGANVDAVGKDGLSGLMRACLDGHGSAVRRWIELQADVELVSGDGRRPIHCATAATLPKSALAPLVEAGVQLNTIDADKRTAVALLLARDQLPAADYLVSHGSRWRGLEVVGEATELGPAVVECLGKADARWAASQPVEPSLRTRTTRSAPPARWVDDADSAACMLCQNAFGFFRRRHHCRSCGSLCCGECLTKQTRLETICTSEGPALGDMSKVEKVCDSCFNYHGFCQFVEPAPAASSPPRSIRSPAARAAAESTALLEGASEPSPEADTNDPGLPAVGASAAAAVMGENKQLLQNNLAKAREISDASDQMAADAQDFASMAKQLADGEKRKSSWW